MASERERFLDWYEDEYGIGWDDQNPTDFLMLTAWQARARLAEQREAELVECLRWYAEKAHLCRLIHSEGDEGRYALAEDGGQRAYAILAKHKAEGTEET